MKSTAKSSGLCRLCAAPVKSGARVCPQCGSRSLLFHAELPVLSIAHIDCDAFFAAVEKRDRPELVDKPVIIGGGQRGVVAAACYQARVYGVRSAMPMWKARKLCPQAVVIKGNHDIYAEEGRRIKDMMRALSPLVESLSIDEAFMDLTGTERLHGMSPAASLIHLQNRILRERGLGVSIGLSYNKFLAKTASDLDKPQGFAVLGRAEAQDFLADKPVGFVYGVGPAFSKSLAQDGILTIADVRQRTDAALLRAYGEAGLRLARLARAEDDRPVRPGAGCKSISSEITFEADIAGGAVLEEKLWRVCENTSKRAKAKHLAGFVVTLKLKTSRHQTCTRRLTHTEPVQLADTLFRLSLPLLQKQVGGKNTGQKYRLIGIGISDLHPPSGAGADLLDPKAILRARAERAGDQVRQKFGETSLKIGRSFKNVKQAKIRQGKIRQGKIRQGKLQ